MLLSFVQEFLFILQDTFSCKTVTSAFCEGLLLYLFCSGHENKLRLVTETKLNQKNAHAHKDSKQQQPEENITIYKSGCYVILSRREPKRRNTSG